MTKNILVLIAVCIFGCRGASTGSEASKAPPPSELVGSVWLEDGQPGESCAVRFVTFGSAQTGAPLYVSVGLPGGVEAISTLSLRSDGSFAYGRIEEGMGAYVAGSSREVLDKKCRDWFSGGGTLTITGEILEARAGWWSKKFFNKQHP